MESKCFTRPVFGSTVTSAMLKPHVATISPKPISPSWSVSNWRSIPDTAEMTDGSEDATVWYGVWSKRGREGEGGWGWWKGTKE
jgi:hypothetical protein